MATIAELDEVVREVRKTKNKNVILLKCTNAYPAEADNTNVITFHVCVNYLTAM